MARIKSCVCARPSLVCLSAHVRPREQQPRHHCVISCYRKRNPHPRSKRSSSLARACAIALLYDGRCAMKKRKDQRNRDVILPIKYFMRLIYIYFFPSIPRFRVTREIVASCAGIEVTRREWRLPRQRVATNQWECIYFPSVSFDFDSRASIFNIFRDRDRGRERERECTLDLKKESIDSSFNSSIQVDALRGYSYVAAIIDRHSRGLHSNSNIKREFAFKDRWNKANIISDSFRRTSFCESSSLSFNSVF